MTNPVSPSELAYFQETTQGTGPASAAAWVSGGTRIRHLSDSLDPASIIPTMIDDTRSQVTIFALNDKVIGIENPEFSFSLPLPGSEAVTADTVQVTETEIMTILRHCLGATWRGYSTTAKTAGAHTGTAVELDANTGYDEGGFLGWAPAANPNAMEIRRITDLTGDVATVDEAFSATPSDGDVISAVAAVHIKESILCNSDGAGGPFTFSWLIQKGGAGSGEIWEVNGSKGMITAINITRNELTSAEIQIAGSSLQDPTELSEPSWTADPSGNAGVPVGPDGHAWLQDYGTPTANSINVNEIGIEVGVPAVRVPTVTEAQTGMEGTALFGTNPADTLITLNIVPWATGNLTDFTARTKKVFRWHKQGAPGSVFGIHASRCEIVESPARGTTDAVSSDRVVLRCHEDIANSAAGDADLWRSKIILLFA